MEEKKQRAPQSVANLIFLRTYYFKNKEEALKALNWHNKNCFSYERLSEDTYLRQSIDGRWFFVL
ncbi:MAG: hypothetical protein IJV31_11265 [Clostridia bacterium]|nr:hypothetical protein [Clostridia bacterium]